MDRKMKEIVKTADAVTKEFVLVYYNNMDNNRDKIGDMFARDSMYVFDGNRTTGLASIQKYIFDLPTTSHVICNINPQPVFGPNDEVSTIIVNTAGYVKHDGKKPKDFTESFVLSYVDDQWKIRSSVVRLLQ
ncbi:NTF2-related export protein-like [Teleopsis dalmanni]|uniref:NTF2-related export protein-like n=1 Tax=Teleopsis dalmanni TaxID=139649 RepID=UPI0018CD2766|nr:NTF2-related export protein-like [Teleopsis dalmanni]